MPATLSGWLPAISGIKIGGLTVANRTLNRAQELAADFSAEAILLSDIPDYLPNTDIVISSTASQLPIWGRSESALKTQTQAIFMVDIAVPRDIEPEVEELEDVYLYTVDDLHEVIENNRAESGRCGPTNYRPGSRGLVEQRSLAVVDTIRAFRDGE